MKIPKIHKRPNSFIKKMWIFCEFRPNSAEKIQKIPEVQYTVSINVFLWKNVSKCAI